MGGLATVISLLLQVTAAATLLDRAPHSCVQSFLVLTREDVTTLAEASLLVSLLLLAAKGPKSSF